MYLCTQTEEIRKNSVRMILRILKHPSVQIIQRILFDFFLSIQIFEKQLIEFKISRNGAKLTEQFRLCCY